MQNFEIKNINKYGLTLKNIPRLKVNRELVNKENGFWRNKAIKAWCMSKSIGPYYDSTDYWLGVYDKPKANGEANIEVNFSTSDGMCGYEFERFFDPSEIITEDDYKIQYLFIKRMNELIEKGVFIK